MGLCPPGGTGCPPNGTMCPSGRGVDPFKGVEATLGRTMCLPGRTGCPPRGTVCPLFRAGSSVGAVGIREKGRGPRETGCPLFAVKKPIQAVSNGKIYTLPLVQGARSGLYSSQVGVGALIVG